MKKLYVINVLIFILLTGFIVLFTTYSGDEKINIIAISTSEIKLSVIINETDTLKAVKTLHTIFDLD